MIQDYDLPETTPIALTSEDRDFINRVEQWLAVREAPFESVDNPDLRQRMAFEIWWNCHQEFVDS